MAFYRCVHVGLLVVVCGGIGPLNAELVGGEGASYVWGDFSGDGALNGLDIPQFKSALADPRAWQRRTGRSAVSLGDFNDDGAFNGLDIPDFKRALAGDLPTGGSPPVTPPPAVPLPPSAILLTLGLAGSVLPGAWRRMRRRR